ncbi:histone deacetylase superfamily [Ochromonadaceae sp. CCMP2298]|nr:histone deacetylase superfamily [Ochromonadaceae sp. CCMP2298]|mmetsp:Transcript_30205/g.66855  ORF Transcript_30205/g.66855 Transcript_30205/m.66855 type:complete len:337 (+) Transcript_30205:62-1072(+)
MLWWRLWNAVALASLLAAADALRPLVITSEKMMDHRSATYHPEQPLRLSETLIAVQKLQATGIVDIQTPALDGSAEERAKVLKIIKNVHDHAYVDQVFHLARRGARMLDPWDSDTYLSKGSFETVLLAQSSWLDGVDAVVQQGRMAFALARPPGHHAKYDGSMGFCIFNFAVGAARYAMQRHGLGRVCILDFDAHYGNGVADLVKADKNIRYSSLHQDGLFPRGRGKVEERGDHGNILNIPLEAGCAWEQYRKHLVEEAVPFLKDFGPDLLIVCAGFDAIHSDETAELGLKSQDYGEMAQILRDAFGPAILFGLEGGYSLEDLPTAVENTIAPFAE